MRFRLVSRLSFLRMKYRCNESEEKENRKLSPTCFCESLSQNPLWLRGLAHQSRKSAKVKCDRENTAALPSISLTDFLVPFMLTVELSYGM